MKLTFGLADLGLEFLAHFKLLVQVRLEVMSDISPSVINLYLLLEQLFTEDVDGETLFGLLPSFVLSLLLFICLFGTGRHFYKL